MKVAVLVVSRNRPDLVERMAAWLQRNMSIEYDLFVVEAGTDPDKLTEHTTTAYQDEEFRGKCYAHNVALDLARKQGIPYDYYWVLMNDVVFDEGVDAARILIEQMEREPRLAILSPTCKDRNYPGSGRRGTAGWRPVTTCDYLGFLMRAEAVEAVGFLNPDFQYCWGAIHELSYLLYRSGWTVGYSDAVEYEHLGGSTYGAKGTNTISREEYQLRAKRFALTYFTRVYGSDWAREFWEAARHRGIEIDTYSAHERHWAEAFSPQELAQLQASSKAPRAANTDSMNKHADAAASPLHRIYLGCGPDRREGWVNVDVNPMFGPDLVANASDLPMLADGSCEIIEACHLFEHLTLRQARAALREWRRLLAPGGELHLELPNLARCVELIGTEMNGFDLGMISLFGYPPEVDEQGEPQLHKWGWTPQSLAEELRSAGFEGVEQVPITQTFRPAAKFDRDMRLVARVAQVSQHAASFASAPAPAEAMAPVSSTQPAGSDAAHGDELGAAELSAVLGWPRYDDQAELDRFFHVFARVLSGRTDVILFLRIDPDLDPGREAVVAAIEASYARTLGLEAQLNVELLEGPISPAEWREIGANFRCRIRSGMEAAPRDAICQAPTPVVSDAGALFSLLSEGSACGRASDGAEPAPARLKPEGSVIVPEGVVADPGTIQRIADLQPWFYPVRIDGMTVVPGLGSVCEPQWLANRAACRASLLVDEVLRRVDMQGRSVLDLACNCAYWSSRYAMAGAARVFGVEGRERHVDQARLYWERGGFLPAGAFEFAQGNISDPSAWDAIRARGRFDVTLCAGILYHVPNYVEILRWAAEVTNEVLIVDTRVQDGAEEMITEPGDLTFNAIQETRDKVVPDRTTLLAALRELGFEPEVMPVGFQRQLGVDDVDSYADGARVTIVARKVPVPAGPARLSVLGSGR